MIYITIIIVIILLYPFKLFTVNLSYLKKGAYKKKRNYIIFIGLIFFLLLSLRCASTGRDTEQYLILFNDLFNYSSFKSWYNSQFMHIEIGYAMWEWFWHLITNYRGFLFANAALMICPILYVAYKKSQLPWMTMLIFVMSNYLTWYMCAARQAPAVSLTILAFFLYKNHKFKSAAATYTLAILFHITAIIVLPVVLLLRFLRNDKILIIAIISSKIISNAILPMILPYMRLDYTNSMTKDSIGQMTYYGFLGLWIIMMMIKRKKQFVADDSFYMFSVMLILWPLVDSIATAFRVTFYFMIYLCFCAPMFVYELRNNKLIRIIFLSSLFFILSTYFNYRTFGHFMDVNPYYSVFEYPVDKPRPQLYNK